MDRASSRFSNRLIARDEKVEVDARKEQTCSHYENILVEITYKNRLVDLMRTYL